MTQFHQTRFEPGSDESRHVLSALKAAKLNFTTSLVPLMYEDPDAIGGVTEMGGAFGVKRSDTGKCFRKPVGSDYTIVDNAAAMVPMQPLLDSGEARIISAGYTNDGARVYIQAQLTGSTVDITPNDSIFTSVNFATGHDGSLQTSAGFSKVRVVCQNTMAAMIASLAWRSRHTKGTHDRLAAFALELRKQESETKEAAELFRKLTTKKLSDPALTRYVREVLSEGAGQDMERTVRGVDRIVELAHSAPGATPGTMWGGLNAVTYWATHERGRDANSRANSLLFDDGTALIARASQVAFELAEHLPSNEMGRAASRAHASASLEFGNLLGRRSVVLDQPDAE